MRNGNTRLRLFLVVALLSGGLLSTSTLHNAAAHHEEKRELKLEKKTIVPIRIKGELSSEKARRGDTFTAEVDYQREKYWPLRRAILQGEVVDAIRKKDKTPGLLDLRCTRLIGKDGRKYDIKGYIVSLQSKYVESKSGFLRARKEFQHEPLRGKIYKPGLVERRFKGSEARDIRITHDTELGVVLSDEIKYTYPAM